MSGESQDGVMDGHAPDGIEEYDNPLPRWWSALFLVTVLFSIGYFGWMHLGGGGESLVAEYEAEQAAADALKPPRVPIVADEPTLAAALQDPAVVAAGKALFQANCVACHGPAGQGGVGPNLTDPYWINTKGTLLGVFTTIRDGVKEKGMRAWGEVLSRDEVAATAAFVASLHGSSPAKPQEPQGERIDKPSWR